MGENDLTIGFPTMPSDLEKILAQVGMVKDPDTGGYVHEEFDYPWAFWHSKVDPELWGENRVVGELSLTAKYDDIDDGAYRMLYEVPFHLAATYSDMLVYDHGGRELLSAREMREAQEPTWGL